jgi:hypothetical protein
MGIPFSQDGNPPLNDEFGRPGRSALDKIASLSSADVEFELRRSWTR